MNITDHGSPSLQVRRVPHTKAVYGTTYNYIQLHTTKYNYIQIHTTTYNYIQLHTTTYNYIQLHTFTNIAHTHAYIPLHKYNYIQLRTYIQHIKLYTYNYSICYLIAVIRTHVWFIFYQKWNPPSIISYFGFDLQFACTKNITNLPLISGIHLIDKFVFLHKCTKDR